MKDILITSFDMEIGGVERSLISLLNNFDYEQHQIDLLIYSHTGDFMSLLPLEPNLLPENKQYKTFRQGIKEVFLNQYFMLGIARLYANMAAKLYGKKHQFKESGIYQMQLIWEKCLPFLSPVEKEYDVAISYLWPHYFVANKVKARIKIAWIHTDHSTMETNLEMDLKVWSQYDYIISISDEVTKSFLSQYPSLESKIVMIENITSPQFIRMMANENDQIPFHSEHFNIVSVGRLCYPKGYDNAVKALRILHDRGYTNLKWYIVGYGGDEPMLRELIAQNGLEDSFILLGKKINPYPYIKACDLYVQPSRYEGKAVTVTEAQILYKPVLITNYETAHSQLKNEFDGYITEKSIEGIADGVEKLYLDAQLREQLVEGCKQSSYGNADELQKLYSLF